MVLYFLIALFGLVALMAIHELGHFLLAKKFKIEVEEFGLGLPPRIFGKKIGRTFYSLNWLPFGAFVKIPALEGDETQRSSSIPLNHKLMVFLGGVIATWLTALIIFIFIAGIWGLPFSATEGEPAILQIVSVQENSPAEEAGLESGDFILAANNEQEILFDQVNDFVSFLNDHRGELVNLTIKRGNNIINLIVQPRLLEEKEEGALGVVIAPTAYRQYSWYQAPLAGLQATISQTIAIPILTVDALGQLIKGEQIPGARIVGPIGIIQLVGEQATRGWDRLLMLIATIAIYLTIFNILPIPALDGGRILFLGVEKIMKKAPNRILENRINSVFFFLLMGLLIFISIKDIIHLFN